MRTEIEKKKRATYMREWRKNNPERAREFVNNSIKKNPEKYKAISKAKYERWKKDKPERLKAIAIKASRKYALKKTWLTPENREKSAVRVKEWARNNPDRMKLIRKRAKAKRRGVVGTYTLSEWETLLKQYAYTCPCCKRSDLDLHADHIIPIIKGGSNFIENIQPLCKSCNSSKFTKIIYYPSNSITQ